MIDDLRADPGRIPVGSDAGSGTRRSIWPFAAVAVVAAVFAGVLWTAYRHGGDAGVNGVPPLVKADTSPTKIKPDSPGGQEIPFQNSTVYDRLGQNGKTPPVAEKLLPPPEAPVDRPPPVAAAPAAVPAVPPVEAPAALAPAQPAAPPVPPIAAAAAPSAAASAASVAAPPTATAPATTPAPTAPPHISPSQFLALQKGAADTASPTALAPPPNVSAPPKTIAPAKTPTLTKAPAPAPEAKVAVVTPAVDKPAEKSAGGSTYRIQIGSVKTADAASAEWSKMRERFPQTLSALKMSASKADLPGKGIFYRIQAGPLDETKAKSACDHLKAQGVGCIVVKG